MKRKLVFLAFCLALTSVLAFAQSGPSGPPGRPPMRSNTGNTPGPGGGPGEQVVPLLTQLLNLTEAQQQSWQSIREQTGNTVEPLAQQARQLRDEIKAVLEAGNADPAVIGAKVIAASGIEAQIKAALDAGKTAFKALLSADQLATLAIFEQIQELMRAQGPPNGGGPRQ